MLRGYKLSVTDNLRFFQIWANTTTRFKIGIKIVVFQLVQDMYTTFTKENKEIFTGETDKGHMPDFDTYPNIEKNKKWSEIYLPIFMILF